MKLRVQLYVQPKAKSTLILTNHLGKYIDHINKRIHIDIIYVNDGNLRVVQQRGITRTPTMVCNGKYYTCLEKIISILTPPSNVREQFGIENASPEELVSRHQEAVINAAPDEEEDNPGIKREEELQRKMAAMQRKRPEMEGVNDASKIRGGRKIVSRQTVKSSFNNDEDFRAASNIDVDPTPVKEYYGEEDGARTLEAYYNMEADRCGRRLNNKNIRWPQK